MSNGVMGEYPLATVREWGTRYAWKRGMCCPLRLEREKREPDLLELLNLALGLHAGDGSARCHARHSDRLDGERLGDGEQQSKSGDASHGRNLIEMRRSCIEPGGGGQMFEGGGKHLKKLCSGWPENI